MSKPSVIVLYTTEKGATGKLAASLSSGLKETGLVDSSLVEIAENTRVSLTDHQAVLFGSPVHMGGMNWKAKKFIDELCGPMWSKQVMKGRFFSVFATGGGFGGAGGGGELAMISMATNFIQLGMNFVPLSRENEAFRFGGSAWGPYIRTNDVDGAPIAVSDEALKAAKIHAAYFADIVTLNSRANEK